MPTDPLINEAALLGRLRDGTALITPDEARFLCNAVLLAAHDRKVVREFFAEVLNTTAEIGITLADLESAGRMVALLAKLDATRKSEVLGAEIDRLCSDWARLRHKLADQFDLVSQCPTTADKVS